MCVARHYRCILIRFSEPSHVCTPKRGRRLAGPPKHSNHTFAKTNLKKESGAATVWHSFFFLSFFFFCRGFQNEVIDVSPSAVGRFSDLTPAHAPLFVPRSNWAPEVLFRKWIIWSKQTHESTILRAEWWRLLLGREQTVFSGASPSSRTCRWPQKQRKTANHSLQYTNHFTNTHTCMYAYYIHAYYTHTFHRKERWNSSRTCRITFCHTNWFKQSTPF